MSETIYASLEYGAYKIETNQYDEKVSGKCYDLVDDIEANILNYRIKKISYILNKNERIDKIKIEYINKKDGTSKICETPTFEGLDSKMEECELEDDEEITNVKFYLKDIKFVGFEIFTNKGKNKKIGYGEENEGCTEKDLEKGGKIVVGFGFNASEKYGVYSIHFYYVDKK